MTGELTLVAEAAWTGADSLSGPIALEIAGGRVTWLGPPDDAPDRGERISVEGCLVSGVVDHHVHISLSDPAAVLRGGVTTTRDLGAPAATILPLARASARMDFDGPHIVAAGPMLTAPGGYPLEAQWAPAGFELEIEGLDHARETIASLARQGAGVIKLAIASDRGPTLDRDLLRAVCELAHAEGLPVTAHVEGHGDTERALEAGVDELAHTPWTETLGDDLIQRLAKRVRMVSTLRIHRDAALETALDNLRRFRAAGGWVLYGTDLPSETVRPGVDGDELACLGAAGLSAREILAAATRHPVGRGHRADLVTVDVDPLADPGALSRLGDVIRAGRQVR